MFYIGHVHSLNQKGSSLEKYLIKIVHLKCNACRIFLRTFWVVIHCLYSPLLWEITEFMKSGARKKVALFVNRPMAFQCMTLKYRHKNSMHTMERLVAPLNKSATYFPSTLLNKTLFFYYENNNKLYRMTIQNVRKKISHALHLKWTILIKYFTSVYQKVSDGNLLFGLSVYLTVLNQWRLNCNWCL